MAVAGIRIEPMAMCMNLLEFPDRKLASAAAAELMAESIRARLDERDHCAIVVSGGSTPGPCFDQLSVLTLDWARITVVPSDERWLPPSHPESNERLIRERLLSDGASAGRILPLYRDGLDFDEAISRVSHDLDELDRPFGCVLLGMGEDGHFASLFPDFTGLSQALDPENDQSCLVVKTASSPYSRISLSLSALLDTKCTILLIFGAAKRLVFEAATAGNSQYPVESLIRHQQGQLTVLWAP